MIAINCSSLLVVCFLLIWIPDIIVANVEGLKGIKIKSFHVTSSILYRFSTTVIESVVTNNDGIVREAFFDVRLPKQAFISNFTLEIDGKIYPGDVQERLKARQTYEKAKKKGQSAGIIATKGKETNRFKVSIGVKKHSYVTFKLTYQELLHRTSGLYDHVLFIRPHAVLQDFQIEVFIKDVRDITRLEAPQVEDRVIRENKLQPITLERSTIERPTSKSAHIFYRPSTEFQSEKSRKGVDIIFTVRYDVAREYNAGDLLVSNGYFVHFFAPSGLTPLPKDVVFILDVSGSMQGRKIAQMKEAMVIILGQLNEDDRFNILRFNSWVTSWKENLINATGRSKVSASSFVSHLRAGGATNINRAVVGGLSFLSDQFKDSASMNRRAFVVFLTDGQATAGETSSGNILDNVRQANKGFPIFGLSFGEFADFALLRSMSAQNHGFVRKIYEGPDATSQLTDFYSQISDIVMSDISFNYVNESVDPSSLTASQHKNLFKGSELVVAGKIRELSDSKLAAVVDGRSDAGHVQIEPSINAITTDEGLHEFLPTDVNPNDFMERLWAFMTIKHMLEDQYAETDRGVIQAIKNKTIEMALKYNFVTPLTSMVVVKPDIEEPTDLNEEKEPEPPAQDAPPMVSVDSDPHFIIQVNGLSDSICFDVMGAHGDVINLLYDEVSGVIVNARVVAERGFRKNRKVNTYLGAIQIIRNKFSLHASPKKVKMGRKVLMWDEEKTVTTKTAMVRVNRRALAVAFDNGVLLAIFRHMRDDKRDYVGFYIANATGLSNETHGLLGQFMFSNFTLTKSFIRNTKTEGRLKIVSPREPEGKYVMATVGHRRNLALNRSVSCWMINHVGKIIEGKYDDYVIDGMTSTDHSLWYPYYAAT